ncbi:methylthioribulose-1-phosphate dehydratase [bacterium BMS3Abin05]|nr:methylthioribulose-1-phosphate dehydratase [bacterium BMS3Abin05]
MMTDWEIRRSIVHYGKLVHRAGFVAATDGNISVRMMEDRLMITASGSALGNLDPAALLYVDFSGQVLQGRGKPSSELPMHLTIYKKRPDVLAIIHTHPPISTAISIAKESLSQAVLPEVVIMFGEIPIAPYATPSTDEGAKVVESLIEHHDVIILDHHGAVTVGKTLEDAFFKLEKLEHAAKTLLTAKQLGKISPLSEEEVKKLKAVRKQLGYK